MRWVLYRCAATAATAAPNINRSSFQISQQDRRDAAGRGTGRQRDGLPDERAHHRHRRPSRKRQAGYLAAAGTGNGDRRHSGFDVQPFAAATAVTCSSASPGTSGMDHFIRAPCVECVKSNILGAFEQKTLIRI